MSRRIITKSNQNTSGATTSVDTYFDRIIKYIPADIVGAWVAVTGLIKSGGEDIPANTLLWVGFLIGIVLTALWTLKQTSVPRNNSAAITQTAVATVSFIIWVFALGGPFANMEFYQPIYGSLVLIFYNLAIGLIIPKEN